MVTITYPKTRIQAHWVSAIAFLGFLGLFLLTVVDIRRGFLFPLAEYYKIGKPSAILYLDPRHTLLLIVAVLGMAVSYWAMRQATAAKSEGLRSQARLLAIAIGALLVVDLLTYRIVPASRILAAGKTSVGRAIDLAAFPAWLRPLGDAVNYFLLVWHATLLAVLIGGLFLAVSPAFVKRLRGRGFSAHLAGAAMAVPQPFCSCCAAPIGSALYRAGASLGPVLAFTVSAPMLNLTSWVLAGSLLPTNLAVLRIGGGLVIGVLATYAVSLLASRWATRTEVAAEPGAAVRLSTRLVNAYSRLFQFDGKDREGALESPAALLARWLTLSWRLGRVVVPVLFVGALLAAVLVRSIPTGTNNLASVAVAALLGTLLMVPTWTEIPVASGLAQQGITGPAAALLLTLPAVSVPCLVVLAGAFRSLKVALLTGALVFVVGLAAGAAFLYL